MREFLRRLFGRDTAKAQPEVVLKVTVEQYRTYGAKPPPRPPLPPEQREVIYRNEYMSAELEKQALGGGLKQARLKRVRDRLVIETPLGWLNPRSRGAHRFGIDCFKVAGTGYYAAAIKSGDFSAGAAVRLMREPNNQHDPNAIAVYAATAGRKAGFVPASHAKRLAPLLDDGTDLVALSMRGGGPREDGTVPDILVCERRTLEQLQR